MPDSVFLDSPVLYLFFAHPSGCARYVRFAFPLWRCTKPRDGLCRVSVTTYNENGDEFVTDGPKCRTAGPVFSKIPDMGFCFPFWLLVAVTKLLLQRHPGQS
jgi:hypothetical protein